jgi:hypothetical protein
MQQAVEHFAPAERGMMGWSTWGPPFTHLHCALTFETSTKAAVLCTFTDINDPDTGMSNVSFWSVDLQRNHAGPWLINNYGQG